MRSNSELDESSEDAESETEIIANNSVFGEYYSTAEMTERAMAPQSEE